MRMLWIASGLAMVLLTCAAIFRQKPADDVVPSGSPEIGPVAPGPLTPEDVSQIVALRAQFGGPADRFGGKETSLTAFEQELRQVAGVEGNVDESPEADGSRPALLRQADGRTVQLAGGPAVLQTADAELQQARPSAIEGFLHAISDPTIALAIPPPASPTGFGISVKNRTLSDVTPCVRT